jgi:predicted PurR-regulated permease PerM
MIATALILSMLSTTLVRTQVATAGPVSVANNSVNDAFSSIYYSEQNGGDVSLLVGRLNVAILLIQKANAENATNPTTATSDISNATTIAQIVSLSSASVSQSGSMARQLRLYESLGTIVLTLGVATMIYLKGDRVYRRLWFLVYRNHVVKNHDE